jgi:L-asparaginase
MPKVLLLHTGGTLGMAGRRPHGLRPAEFHRTLRRRAPELFELADVEFELFCNLDSAEMQPELWSEMAAHLHHRLDGVDGAVVTHGTDTLAYTAAALSFMLTGLDKAVVLTGSQRPLGEIRSDARLNLVDAVTSALRGPREVTVCFDSHLYRGNRVRKVKVSEYDAFESPNFPVLGTLGVEAAFAPGLARRRGRRVLRAGLVPRVFLLKVFPGMDPQLPLQLLPHVEGLVLEAYGAGTLPVDAQFGRSLRPLLAEARRRNVPVVLTSQAHRNGVDLGLYESGVVAAGEGALSGGDMTSSTALVKLMHALAHHDGLPRVRTYMERNVCGERTPPHVD